MKNNPNIEKTMKPKKQRKELKLSQAEKAIFRQDVYLIVNQALKDQRLELVEKIEKLKTDERKVADFGEWQAETYNDKMLVNAVLDKVLSLIRNKEEKWKI